MGVVETATTIVFVAAMGMAAVSDLRSRRIPNRLTAGSLVLALVLRGITGLGPLLDGLAGAGLALAVGLLLFVLGGFGGGDAKLLVVVGAFLGFEPTVGALLLIGVLGGLLGTFEAVRRRAILPAAYNAAGMMRRWVSFGRRGEGRTLESPGALAVPYGLAIATGAVIWWFWGVPVL
ncbi:MAG TPA: A24 family peptidase [Gemmatimonadales bacterium]|nr:A24 family peptidase [Gemmatimonadales bacterium]